jgi:hypothetical protein
MCNEEAEYEICWYFSEWRQCGFCSSAYCGTNVPINIRTAGVETRIGFSYSVTQQPDVTWQHSSLKPVSSYCKSKYGRTTRRKAACRESDARRFASNDESGAAVDMNLVLKILSNLGWTRRLCLVRNRVSRNPSSRAIYWKRAEITWKRKIWQNMVWGCGTLERHEKCLQTFGRKTRMEETT